MKKLMSILIAAVLLFGTFTAAQAAGNDTIDYNWAQGDARWKKVTSGISWNKACAVTSIAIQIARSGLVSVDESATSFNTSSKEGFNPGTFAKSWLSKRGLATSASVTWATVSSVVEGFERKTDSRYTKSSTDFSYYPATKTSKESAEQRIVNSLTAFFEDGYSVIVEGPGSKFSSKNTGSRHYVPVVEADGRKVWVIDPIDGKRKSLFDVQPNGTGTRWTAANLDICGNPKGCACCVLYKVNPDKVLPTQQDAESNITIKDEVSPEGNYQVGEKFYFKGMISSVYPLKSVYGGIFDANGREVQVKSYAPNTTTFDIAKTLDYMIRMAKLPVGDYAYAVCVEDTKGYNEMVIQRSFAIVDPKATQLTATATPCATDARTESELQSVTPTPAATPEPTPAQTASASTPTPMLYEMLKVTVNGEDSPSGNYAAGTKFYFRGILNSDKVMESVYGGIFSSDGKEVQCASYPCKGTTFDIYKTFDRMIRMGKLPFGDYIYAIYVIDTTGIASEVIVSTFQIV